MMQRFCPLVRSGVMLHNVVHQHRHWRQAGQLYCAFCSSSIKQAEKQPSVQAAASTDKDPIKHLKDNPFFNKYADKMREKQQASPEDFVARVKALEEDQKRKEEEAKKLIEKEQRRIKEKALESKKLENIMKLDLIKDKSKEEIEEIWKGYFKDKDKIFAVIPKDEFEEMKKRSQQFPTFMYPIPRQQGYEFMLQQFNGNDIGFTPLIQYQTHKENAPQCLTMTHYTELMEDKGIVLMVGEPDLNIISIYEAQLLAMQVKMYYGLHSGLKFNLVRQLNLAPDSFKYMDLVKEFENYKKDSKDAVTGDY